MANAIARDTAAVKKSPTASPFLQASKNLFKVDSVALQGRVTNISGLFLEIMGMDSHLCIGDRVFLHVDGSKNIQAEVIGFYDRTVRAMVFDNLHGVGPGTTVITPIVISQNYARARRGLLYPDQTWLGRVIDPLGYPLDERGNMLQGSIAQEVQSKPPEPNTRARLGRRLDLGVSVLDLFTTCREGQRLGFFAGSGIGKSSLLSMLARFVTCDVIVLALVGERGREVRELLEDDLGTEALSRTVTVVATSDAPALMRREAAYAAMTVAEHFRDKGKSVMLLMDSVTRFCSALREIGLSAGEPPTTRGYPPRVFAELPCLLERAGPGKQKAEGEIGQITGLFAVLVDGDDHDEPIADAVRGILDGHVILDRRIAERGRFPAVDVLRSLSRTVPGCLNDDERNIVRRARAILATYTENADSIRLGSYKEGADKDIDEAVLIAPRIEAILYQNKTQYRGLNDSFNLLYDALESSVSS